MTEVLLIRPGCTDFDDQQRIQGTLNLPLNDRGQAQIGEFVDQLRDVAISLIFTAPAEPALSTAIGISTGLGGVRVKELAQLHNVDQGLWQGLQVDDVRRKYPRVYKQWREAPETVCPPEGETVPNAMKRVAKALGRALKKNKPIAVVASEPLATLIACYINGHKPQLPEQRASAPGVSRVEFLSTVQSDTTPFTAGDCRQLQHGKTTDIVGETPAPIDQREPEGMSS